MKNNILLILIGILLFSSCQRQGEFRLGEFNDNAVLRFEYPDVTDLGRRYVDLVDETEEGVGGMIFYEMKSVQSVPPGHFAEQFIKDLSNPDITHLDQIRWRFNGEKAPDNFRENMMKAIDRLPLTDELAKKLININANKDMLRIRLKSNFDKIFQLK